MEEFMIKNGFLVFWVRLDFCPNQNIYQRVLKIEFLVIVHFVSCLFFIYY